MKRAFLDANVLFSAAWSPNGRVAELWKLSNCALVSSGYCAEESRRNLETPEQQQRLVELLKTVELVPDVSPVPVAGLPAKDAPVLLAAAEAAAAYLVTGDRNHFGKFYGKMLQGVKVLRPDELAAELD